MGEDAQNDNCEMAPSFVVEQSFGQECSKVSSVSDLINCYSIMPFIDQNDCRLDHVTSIPWSFVTINMYAQSIVIMFTKQVNDLTMIS